MLYLFNIKETMGIMGKFLREHGKLGIDFRKGRST